jgi:hypothetical protein
MPLLHHVASGVLWVNQDEILVIYSTATDFNHLFFFDKTQFTYLDEIQGAYDDVHPKPQYHFRLLKHFGPNIEYLVTILSASGPDITLVGKQTGASWNKWDTANDNGIPTMPLNDDDGDTFPVGAVVDLGATNPLPPVDPSVSEVPVPPMPILLFLTTDGHVCAYHMYNSVLAQDNLKYQGMVTSKGIAAVTKPVAKSASAPLQLNVNKPPSGFSFASAKTVNSSPSFGTSTASGPGSSTFGNSSFGKTNFGNTSFGNTNVGNTSFGKTNFGNTSFGNTNFGSAAPSAVQTVSLASLATSVSKDPSTNSLDRAFPAPSSTQNSIFQPASLGTATNSPSLNQPSMSNVSMFSSQGAKRTAATPECNGFELGGFSKALASDEREEREETDETDESDGVISSDEEDEYEDQEDYEDQDALSANSTIIKRPEPLFVQYQEKEIQPKTHDRVAKHVSHTRCI